MKTLIYKTPEVTVKAYGISEYQIRDEDGIQVGSLSTEFLFSSGKYHAGENKEDAIKELEHHVKKIAVVDDLLEQLNKVVDAIEDGSINRDHLKASKDLIKKATE